jgi:drug/metabolite transporter (DMT)-like permease
MRRRGRPDDWLKEWPCGTLGGRLGGTWLLHSDAYAAHPARLFIGRSGPADCFPISRQAHAARSTRMDATRVGPHSAGRRETADLQNRPMQPARSAASPFAIGLALGVVYLVWGSTYLAIRVVVETLPPFLAAGARFLVAGALVVVALWIRGRLSRSPTARLEPVRGVHWRSAAIIGGLLLLGGNGFVMHAEQTVDSGIAAVLVAAVPIWMNLFDAIATRRRPGALTIGGVLAGFLGVVVLVAPVGGVSGVDPLGVGFLVVAAIAWAFGSLYARNAPMPRSGLLATGMEMLAGGALLVVAGGLTGEFARANPAQFSQSSLLALAYLVVFGSLAGFTAYIWLLHHAPVATAATYAYVNPVVAVILGAAILSEPITARTAIASILILGAVVAMVSGRPRIAQEEGPGPEAGMLEPPPDGDGARV